MVAEAELNALQHIISSSFSSCCSCGFFCGWPARRCHARACFALWLRELHACRFSRDASSPDAVSSQSAIVRRARSSSCSADATARVPRSFCVKAEECVLESADARLCDQCGVTAGLFAVQRLQAGNREHPRESNAMLLQVALHMRKYAVLFLLSAAKSAALTMKNILSSSNWSFTRPSCIRNCRSACEKAWL